LSIRNSPVTGPNVRGRSLDPALPGTHEKSAKANGTDGGSLGSLQRAWLEALSGGAGLVAAEANAEEARVSATAFLGTHAVIDPVKTRIETTTRNIGILHLDTRNESFPYEFDSEA
jgi:hypothetical protein